MQKCKIVQHSEKISNHVYELKRVCMWNKGGFKKGELNRGKGMEELCV